MKLLLSILLLMSMPCFKMVKHDPYSTTGHEQFEEFIVPKGRRILISYTDYEIKRKYKDVPFALFGSESTYFDKYIPIEYKSTVIFSRSNKTRESYTFAYNLESVKYEKISVAIKGSINVKAAVKIKKVDVSGGGDVSISYTKDTSETITESGKLNIVIYPNKKMTLRIVGEARVSNGVSKYYVFGICMKKGAFEIVEITSTIYELLEEDA